MPQEVAETRFMDYPPYYVKTWVLTRWIFKLGKRLLLAQYLLGKKGVWIRRQIRRDGKVGWRAFRWCLRYRDIGAARSMCEVHALVYRQYGRHYLDSQMLASARDAKTKEEDTADDIKHNTSVWVKV